MNHRPHHNLTQMSHWIKTDNRNRNSTKHCCHQVPWKDKSFWIHFKTEFSTLASEDLFSTMYHSPTRKDSISSRANALATRTSSLVWYSRVTLSRKMICLKTWFEFSSNPHDIRAAIAAWICFTVMQMSFSRSLFTDKDNLPFFCMNTLERLLKHCLYGIPAHIIPCARRGQHVRTTHSSIKVQTKSKEKTVNRYLFIGIIFISQKLTDSQHYLDACLLFRCWLKAVSTISWWLAVEELLGNSSSLTRPVLSNTRWILGRGTLKRSQNRSNTKERFIFLDHLVLLVDIASWLCDQHRPLKRNEKIKRLEAFWIYSHVNDMTFDNRQFIIANILIFSRFDRYLDLPELHVGVGSVNNHL